MNRRFVSIAVFVAFAVVSTAMVETVAAGKYGVVTLTVYEQKMFSKKLCPGASVKLDDNPNPIGITDSKGKLRIGVTLGEEHTIFAEKVCDPSGIGLVPLYKSGSVTFMMKKKQQSISLIIKGTGG